MTTKQKILGISCELGEFLIVVLAGMWLNISFEYIALTLLAYVIPRLTIGKGMHYKVQRLCFVWTVVVYMSMVVVAHAGIVLSILMAIFTALILSGHANIMDVAQFKPKGESNYKILMEYIKYKGTSDEFLKAEELLQKRVSPQEYLIFKRILIDGHTWEPIINEFGISPAIIQSALDKCYFFMIGRLNQ